MVVQRSELTGLFLLWTAVGNVLHIDFVVVGLMLDIALDYSVKLVLGIADGLSSIVLDFVQQIGIDFVLVTVVDFVLEVVVDFVQQIADFELAAAVEFVQNAVVGIDVKTVDGSSYHNSVDFLVGSAVEKRIVVVVGNSGLVAPCNQYTLKQFIVKEI